MLRLDLVTNLPQLPTLLTIPPPLFQGPQAHFPMILISKRLNNIALLSLDLRPHPPLLKTPALRILALLQSKSLLPLLFVLINIMVCLPHGENLVNFPSLFLEEVRFHDLLLRHFEVETFLPLSEKHLFLFVILTFCDLLASLPQETALLSYSSEMLQQPLLSE